MPRVYIGLVHYPIYNRQGSVITTAVTNFDVHDIARTARTYNIVAYFIIHPLESQAGLVREIMEYWREGFGSHYNPDRKEAFQIVRLLPDIEAARAEIEIAEGKAPLIVTTDARTYPNSVSYQFLREKALTDEQPLLLLFGTGWGIEQSVMNQFDYILEPIYGGGEYNPLPVRAAVAIILDRLLGEPWWTK
ncbi:MAG: RNA methyltransferase [Negativicutes bacterium]|nr:RNA methyltransferase [Negativicutes bacterium]